MANRFVQAPSHGGGYRSGQPTLIVVHSLEAPARRGLAWDLANGWLQTAPVSPHAVTDPTETVDTCSESIVGWQCGNGNQVSIGLEVTGYAAWNFEQWTTGDAFAAVRLDAKRAAEAAKRHGIPLRWLSLQQIRNGESGFCFHADISATLGGTSHTDPGQGFPAAIFMRMVQQWAGGQVVPGTNPNPQPGGGTGGSEPRIPTLTEVGMFIMFGPGGAALCGPGYIKNLNGEEYDRLSKVPGMQVVSVDQRGWDVTRAALVQGDSTDKIEALPKAVWDHPVPSFVTNDEQQARNMLGWTNAAAEAAKAQTAPKA